MFSRASARPQCLRINLPSQQTRNATLIRRPKRPYTLTQLVVLSDGSTFTHRTTSPETVYRTTRDTKNNALWNPSSQKLLNIEEDDAGRLKRFRQRFGRGFDAENTTSADEVVEGGHEEDTGNDDLMDLISGYGRADETKDEPQAAAEKSKKAK